MENVKKILFVCTGNSCRSIMAEAYMSKRAPEEGFALEIKSAGTLGINGMLPTKEAFQALSEAGITDKGQYHSKALTEELINWADMILVMEHMHKAQIVHEVPAAREKVFFLGEFDPDRKGDVSIPDPIGRTMAFYRITFTLIKHSIEELLKWLKK
ncbi:MAG: low molecular weight protein arginine phosphatase [Candidatus Omnitrophota bacterium]